jgi:hypothetical protein
MDLSVVQVANFLDLTASTASTAEMLKGAMQMLNQNTLG